MKISELLRICGVRPQDTAVVKCALGAQIAGQQVLLDELRAFFAPGVLVMPTGGDAATAVPGGIFDPVNTPSGEGELSELFRSLPDVVRSCHPVNSLAALGESSQWLMAGHELCPTSYSPASPWWKICQQSGKMILIGCGLESAGVIAAAEEWAGSARLSKRFYHRRLALGNGRNRRIKVKFHTGNHALNYFKAEELLKSAGLLSRSTWDYGDVIVMDMNGCVDFLLRHLRRKPRFFAARRRSVNLKKI